MEGHRILASIGVPVVLVPTSLYQLAAFHCSAQEPFEAPRFDDSFWIREAPIEREWELEDLPGVISAPYDAAFRYSVAAEPWAQWLNTALCELCGQGGLEPQQWGWNFRLPDLQLYLGMAGFLLDQLQLGPDDALVTNLGNLPLQGQRTVGAFKNMVLWAIEAELHCAIKGETVLLRAGRDQLVEHPESISLSDGIFAGILDSTGSALLLWLDHSDREMYYLACSPFHPGLFYTPVNAIGSFYGSGELHHKRIKSLMQVYAVEGSLIQRAVTSRGVLLDENGRKVVPVIAGTWCVEQGAEVVEGDILFFLRRGDGVVVQATAVSMAAMQAAVEQEGEMQDDGRFMVSWNGGLVELGEVNLAPSLDTGLGFTPLRMDFPVQDSLLNVEFVGPTYGYLRLGTLYFQPGQDTLPFLFAQNEAGNVAALALQQQVKLVSDGFPPPAA
jgi:hypothetical protein